MCIKIQKQNFLKQDSNWTPKFIDTCDKLYAKLLLKFLNKVHWEKYVNLPIIILHIWTVGWKVPVHHIVSCWCKETGIYFQSLRLADHATILPSDYLLPFKWRSLSAKVMWVYKCRYCWGCNWKKRQLMDEIKPLQSLLINSPISI